jgi:porphobilinogen synthase
MTQIHTHATLKLTKRHRRLRTSTMMRALVQETRLSPEMFVLPLFVCEGENVRREVPSMPGVYNLSVDEAVLEVERAKSDGIRSVLLFGIPGRKDDIGSLAYDPEAPVQSAIRAIKQQVPDVLVITDVCLCEYTDHGHCGIVIDDEIVNDPSVEQLVRAAVSHAAAGADIVAPSDMMDGRVGAIREALDARGFEHTAIMSYAAKYCSAFYGPFRDAAGSTPQFGDRKTHQMDPANVDEALREAEQDIAEGADIIMVKPALPYLDVVSAVRSSVDVPVAAYQISGEFAMVEAAAARGWIDRERAMLETLTSIRRAGAQIILTYWAVEAAHLLR